ncbi:hypothetical protein ANN_13346 [Periplaneta americana]|uniref:FAST kinase-like protein subdomain 2 domain-containing protein n=1 Tax=Periplaneta americana TaxID=6978 RepID=A0ABQ8TJ65_PERAM|nr:hypothetical protein ANN_13346 [Periplaneta americana]
MVDEWNEDMSADAMTASLLYLNKMGVSQTHPVLQNLVARCESMLEDCGQRFPLTAMSRFAVAVHSRRGLWPVLISNKMLPCVLARIESCDNVEDFRLLTICLINICQLVTGSLLTIYKRKAEELADKGKITAHDARVISKAVRFLNYPHWSYYNGATIRKLLLIMKGNVSSVAPKDLISLHKIFQSQLEPADMAEEMHDAASQYLAQVEDERIASNPTVFQVTTDLLACMVSFSSPTQKLVLEKLAQHHVVGSSSSSLPTLFKILRHLKTSNVQLCDKFWSRTLRHMEEIPTEREDYKLFRVSHRYMHFNNNLGGTYRHYELEKQMIEWLWNEVKTGSAGVMPSKFARAAAFILAYGNIGQGKTAVAESTLTQMMHKLMDMAPQFSKLDCMYISRGLQIGAVLGYQKRAMTSQFLDVFRNIDTVMNNCTLEYLKDKEIALPDLNRMIKAYICRRGMHGTELFERLMQRDKERLQGLVLLNAAIALCFFHQLPEDLVHFIFTVSFLERLDEEVLNCYAKASYPTRIRHAMMQVNRAVCLDYPEADVPWFHEKYCEQITSLESPRQSSFRDDVYHSLVSVIGAENLVQTNKYSPYFYRIDFQVLLNKNEKPVTLRHQTDSNVTNHLSLRGKKFTHVLLWSFLRLVIYRIVDAIINAHPPTEEKDDYIKDSFYEELEHTFDQLSRYHMKILLKDINAEVGREDIFKPTIGKKSLHAQYHVSGVNGRTLSLEGHNQPGMLIGHVQIQNNCDRYMLVLVVRHCDTC